MALEQIVKDLQTQNAQFQQMIMDLDKGKEELKALIVKENTNKPAGMVNLGRRFRGPLTQVVELTSSSKEGDNQEGETREEDPSLREFDNETDYNEEQYPLADEKYKQLE